MIANHWIDPYTLAMGVHTMDVVIQALCVSGLVYAPFAIAITVSIVEAMTQGEDEGNAGELAVKFLRQKMFMMMPVFMLAFIPMSGGSGSISSTTTLPSCSSAVIQAEISATTTSMIGRFSGSQSLIPVWWAAVHDFSTVITNATVAAMPCVSDLNAVATNINSMAFTNLEDQQISQAWGKSCLSAAANSISKTEKYDDAWWAGHPKFLTEYAKEQNTITIPTESATAAGLSGVNQGASTKVNCLTAYEHLMGQMKGKMSDLGVIDDIKDLAKAQNLTPAEVVSRTAASTFTSVKNPLATVKMVNGSPIVIEGADTRSDTEDNFLTVAIAEVKQAMANVMNAPDAVAYREAIPIQIGVSQMVLLSVIPLLLVFSGYDLKVCLTLAGLYFGLEFTQAILAFATWVDGVIIVISGNFIGGSQTYARGVGLQLYTLLPQVWFMMLGFIGVIALPMSFTEIGSASQNAIKGAQMAMKIAKAVSSGGTSLAKG